MKRTRFSLIISAAAALAVFLGSCAEGPVGIFASVAAETDINRLATKEFGGTSPSFVAKLGGTYYAGVGGLWKRGVAETSWTKVSVNLPVFGTGDFAAISGINITIATVPHIFVLFVNPTTKSKLGVYKSINGTNWDPLDLGPIAVNELSHIMTDGADVFAVTAKVTEADGEKSTTHSIFISDGSAAFDALDSPELVDADIGLPTSITLDGGNYYISAGEYIATGTAGSMAIANPATETSFSSAFKTSSGVFFTGRDGKIYNSTAAASSTAFEDYNDRPYSFSIPAVVTAGGQTTLLVPSRAYPQGTVRDQGLGYLEFDATGFTVTSPKIADKSRRISTLNNYFITLDGKSVKQILAFDESGDATHERLFALTDGDGLWSNQWQGSSWSGWRRE